MCRILRSISLLLCIQAGFSSCIAQAKPSGAPEREESALSIIERAVAASGGMHWRSIQRVRTTGQVVSQVKKDGAWSSETTPIDWLDDWSTGHPQYRRTFHHASKDQTAVHEGGETFKTRAGDKVVEVRQFDVTLPLLTHLPAAALSHIVSDSRYEVKMLPQMATSNETAVLVRIAALPLVEIWFFSNGTGLPDAVRFSVPDIRRPVHPAWESAIYKHYRQDGSLFLPDQVTLTRPVGQPIEYSFSTIDTHPAVRSGEFSRENNP